jgi:hypothetical protein
MPVYTIKLLLPAENEYGMDETEQIVADLDAAINDHGLLGGNFLVTEVTEDEVTFERAWSAKMMHAELDAETLADLARERAGIQSLKGRI